MASKPILLRYQENRKKVVIPAEKTESDLEFLESSFCTHFKFQNQVNLVISFQRFDKDFEEFVDLEPDEELLDLNVIVTPILISPQTVSSTFCAVLYAWTKAFSTCRVQCLKSNVSTIYLLH